MIVKSKEDDILSEIVRWNIELRADDIPQSVLQKARCQILSVLASVYAGRSLEEAGSVLNTVRKTHRGKDATILATGEKASLEGALLANMSMGMAHDFDDYLFMGHTGHSAVLVSLALCEVLDKTLADLLTCQVAANEIAGRLGASAAIGPLNGQMWSFIHLAASCCIGGRLLGLTREQMENALGIALSQPPYPLPPGFFGTGAKLLIAAWPSILGLQAAFFAREGMTGPKDILSAEDGFYKTFSYYPIRGAWAGLGERWLTETLAVKRYPGCAYLDSALDAFEAVQEQINRETGRPLEPAELRKIEIHATLLTCEMERLAEDHEKDPLHPVLVNFSLRYSLAWRLLTNGMNAQELTEENVSRLESRIRALADRISVVPDAGLNRNLLQSLLDHAGLRGLLREMGPRGLLTVLRKASGQYSLKEHLSSKSLGEEKRPFSVSVKSTGEWMRWAAGLWSRRSSSKAPRFSLEDVRPDVFEFPFAARIEVLLNNGASFTREQRVPTGAPGNHEMDLLEVSREKFSSQAKVFLGKKRAVEAMKALEAPSLSLRTRSLIAKLVRPAPSKSKGRGTKGRASRS